MKIIFICSAGMSTNLLVQKTLKAAADKNINIEIDALSDIEARDVLDKYDAALLGPQVRFLASSFKEQYDMPIDVIDPVSYGRMDGLAVLEQILELLGNTEKNEI